VRTPGFFPIPTFGNQLSPYTRRIRLIHLLRLSSSRGQTVLAYLMEPTAAYLLDNEPQFVSLPFTDVTPKWDADQTAFLETYPAKTIVYQDVVNYVNPQWMDIGRDMVDMFTGGMTPEDVMSSIDQRRTELAMTAGDPAWAE
jgi:raffinose/stachyose/melibiose transport system substrate-binding protein